MAAKNNAKLPDLSILYQAGIDPKTGLPLKLTSGDKSFLKEDMARIVGLIDRQNAFNRFTWYNLPSGLTGEMMERLLYYKGQGAFFYMEANDTFYFLPYALSGNIDVYGRYLSITPLPMGGPAAADNEGGNKTKAWIDGLVFNPIYEVLMPDEANDIKKRKSCVLLKDYCNGISQTITPRVSLNKALIDTEAEMIPFMRTALLSATGIAGLRVNSQDEQSNVNAAAKSVEQCALTGQKWVPVVGNLEFQDLSSSTGIADVNQFMLAMNSLDNLRLSTYGLDNGGVFEKQGTILQDEANAASVNTGLILQDGLNQRQDFCDRVNSLWGLSIWCEITQPETPLDGVNEDGAAMDEGEMVEGGTESNESNE